MSTLRVRDIERAIGERFPRERAEEWDRVGLLAGDPNAQVTGVTLALDPTRDTVLAAAASGANVLVTHHPAFLTPPDRLTAGPGPGGVVFAALSRGVALINAHTNLDRDAQAQSLMPDALGLTYLGPLERALQPMTVVTVFVPESDAERVVDAMAAAGAGRIGDYTRCAYATEGNGTFVAPSGTTPAIGFPGTRTDAVECRIEMVCPASLGQGVAQAAIAAHPYEEPLVVVEQGAIARNAARLGAVCECPEPMTLSQLVAKAASVYECTPRAWGNADSPLERVATATGSAGSLVRDAAASGVQALVAGEVRYHDALDAVAAGLAVVELGHDVTEWPLVDLLADTLCRVEGLSASTVHVLPATRGWWTPNEAEGVL